MNWAQFYPLLKRMEHGRLRTQGTGKLYQQFALSLSRRQLAGIELYTPTKAP